MTPERFKEHRQRLGLNKAALAEQLGIHRHTVAHYESGERPAPRGICLAIAALLLGIPPAQ